MYWGTPPGQFSCQDRFITLFLSSWPLNDLNRETTPFPLSNPLVSPHSYRKNFHILISQEESKHIRNGSQKTDLFSSKVEISPMHSQLKRISMGLWDWKRGCTTYCRYGNCHHYQTYEDNKHLPLNISSHLNYDGEKSAEYLWWSNCNHANQLPSHTDINCMNRLWMSEVKSVHHRQMQLHGHLCITRIGG